MLKKSITVVIFFIMLSSGCVQAEGIQDIIDDIKQMELDSENDYSEIGKIKLTTLSYLYTMPRENVPPEVVEFSNSVKDFLNDFESGYQRTQSESTVEREKAIEDMKALKNEVKRIEAQSNGLGEKDPRDIAEDASNVVNKFLDDEGDYFMELFGDGDVTPLRIIYLNNSIDAYGSSGNAGDRDEALREYAEITAEFDEAMRIVNEKKQSAGALIANARGSENSSSPMELFSAFMDAQRAANDLSDAERKCIEHKLDLNESIEYAYVRGYNKLYIEISDEQYAASELSKMIFGSLLKYIVIFSAIAITIITILTRAYLTYRYDTEDTKLSDELVFAK
ncbi:MAG: hypothetical protein A7315_10455 [Candidatus Altiarchaeales archaeon WOR_SM1_79]|nr:MAG: hypothetical protein A7315_10455 [Candidatus Altiarchaeales archaeon WOR_SM1_79]